MRLLKAKEFEDLERQKASVRSVKGSELEEALHKMEDSGEFEKNGLVVTHFHQSFMNEVTPGDHT